MNKILFPALFLGIAFLAGCTSPTSPNTNTLPPAQNSGTTTNTSSVIPPPPVAEKTTPIIARGTEPFWSFVQTSTGAHYSFPDATGVTQYVYTLTQTNSGAQIIVSATPVASGSAINLTLTPGTCSDGMSDLVYAYTASGTYGTQSLMGCAN